MQQHVDWQPWIVHRTAVDRPQGPRPPAEQETLNDIEWHPALLRLISQLPPRLAVCLTADELQSLSAATRPNPSRHAIEYRVSVPFLWRRYYLTIFAGRERRDAARLRREGQTSLGAVSIAATVALYGMAGVGAVLAIVAAYLVKSVLGLDLFEGPSVLHGLFF